VGLESAVLDHCVLGCYFHGWSGGLLRNSHPTRRVTKSQTLCVHIYSGQRNEVQ
jgi:hypothetical protein